MSKKRPGKDYKIGYAKPPRHRQYKPGESGNPGGRPRKRKASDIDPLSILDGTVNARVGGSRRQMSTFEAATRRLVQRAIQEKHLGSILELLSLFERYGLLEGPEALHGVIHVNPRPMKEWEELMAKLETGELSLSALRSQES